MGFPGGSDGKESACNAGDLGSVPGSGISPEEGNGYPLQYSCLENSMDRGVWWATVYGAQRVGHDWVPNIHTHTHVNYTSIKMEKIQLSSVQLFSWSDSLRPHGLQHTRLPCQSSTPRACSNSCPSSWWCHTTISSSVVPFSFCIQTFPHKGLFQWVSSLYQVAKVLEFQLQCQSFQWIFRTDFL